MIRRTYFFNFAQALILAVVLVILYYPSHRIMVAWWKGGDYNYCYLIPFIVLYLLWEKRDELRVVPRYASWFGLIPLLLGISFYWLGELGGEFYTLYLSSWLVLVGVCWMNLGWKKIKTIAFPLIMILTMFPPPNFIYFRLSLNLKLLSSKLGVWMMQAYGMSAYREGNIIDLGFTQLQVVDACSGLRFLFPMIVMGLILAYFYKTSFWKRAIIVISTVPLTVVTNSLRIALTGILYEVWGPAVAEGFFHGFSGWFIFMVTLLILLGEMYVLGFRLRSARPSPGTEPDATRAEDYGEQVPAPNSGNSLRGWKALFYPPQFVVASGLLLLTFGLSYGVEFREKIPMNKPFSRFPMAVGEWRGTRETLGKQFIDALDLSDYVIVDFENRENKHVNLYVAYYESQRKGESIHSPSTCLPGSGWVFNEAGEIRVPTPGYGKGSIPVRRAYMQKGAYRQLSYYWFPQRGRILTNAYQLKIYNFWDALTRQRTDGALVRLITPVYDREEPADAERRLQAFTREILPVLSQFLPG